MKCFTCLFVPNYVLLIILILLREINSFPVGTNLLPQVLTLPPHAFARPAGRVDELYQHMPGVGGVQWLRQVLPLLHQHDQLAFRFGERPSGGEQPYRTLPWSELKPQVCLLSIGMRKQGATDTWPHYAWCCHTFVVDNVPYTWTGLDGGRCRMKWTDYVR